MTKARENTVISGEVVEILPNTMFRVRLTDDRLVVGVPSGRLRRGYMRLLPGAKVKVEMTPYDQMRGRIIEGGKAKRPR